MDYLQEYSLYCKNLKTMGIDTNDFTEFKFESLIDYSDKETIKSILKWYNHKKNNSNMRVEKIPLSECKKWKYKDNSEILHDSGEFYKIIGYRVTGTSNREVVSGWDQPLITQVGYDGGILGLIRKRFNNIPYYLVEAKEEPGNYNLIQISTTVQATFSNLKRAHKGNLTNYSDLFLNYKKHPVQLILDQWMSEDGGRLYNKRNKIIILEHDQDTYLELVSDNYKWLTLYQIKDLIINYNAIIAPHLRSAISGL